MKATVRGIDWSPVSFADLRKSVPVGDLAPVYLRMKAAELEPGGYKALRYSVNLFVSRHKDVLVASLGRDDGKDFLRDIAKLSASLGKSYRYHRWSLDALLRASENRRDKITVMTQKRIWAHVKGFLSWIMYEGHLGANPFQTVRFEGKGRTQSYAVPTDQEALLLLQSVDDPRLDALLRLCLLTGMRMGEALGLCAKDVFTKGNLGAFIKIRPNDLRKLKTEAAEKEVPVHSALSEVLSLLPKSGPLFLRVTVNMMTKAFAKLRGRIGMAHLVFHETRKWFITQCERTGVPEHFTASLVGHKAARSGNCIT